MSTERKDRRALIAFLVLSLNAHLLAFLLIALIRHLLPAPDPVPTEPGDAPEYMVFVEDPDQAQADDREPDEEPDDEDDPEQPEPDQQDPDTPRPDDDDPVEPDEQDDTPDDEPEPQPEDEEQEDVAMIVPPEEVVRQSVDQPTSNEQEPDSDDYFLSAVDNTADEQTLAENATVEDQDPAPVDRQAFDSDDVSAPAAPSVAAEQDPDLSEEQLTEQDPTDARDAESSRGTEDPRDVIARQQLERRQDRQREQAARDPGSTSEPPTERPEQLPFERADEGTLRAPERATTAESWVRDRGLAAAIERQRALEQLDGSGRDTVTRDGAATGVSRMEQLFGERTATAEERMQREARRSSIAGDHEGDWQRTREAMENFDVAVTTGSETQLNTRRDDHAPFINAYHRRIHDPWHDFINRLNFGYTRDHPINDLSLETRLEIRVLADGTVDRVRIIRGSGDAFFDAEAIRLNYAVGRGASPPENILCNDRSVYLHWTFSRTPGRCGTHRAGVHCPR